MIEGDAVVRQAGTFLEHSAVKSCEVHAMKLDEAAVDGEGQVAAVQSEGHVHLGCTSVEQHLFEDASSVVGTNELDLNARLVGEVLEEFL